MAVLNIPIKLDVAEENIMSDVMAMQGDLDSRFLIVTVANHGIPMNIDSHSSVSINIRRPDDDQQTFTGEVNEDGTVTVMIPSWALVLEGVCNCNISFIETDGTILSTMPFNIVVNPSNATEIIVYVVYGTPLAAGTYYITIDDEDYSFTTTEEIPIGGTIRFSRDFTLASTYKCKVIEKDLPITNEAEGTKLSEGTNGGIIKQIIRFMSHIAQRTTQNEEDIDDINATIDNIEQNIDEIEENKRDRITDAHELDSVYIQKPDRTESHIEATSDSIENTIVVRNNDKSILSEDLLKETSIFKPTGIVSNDKIYFAYGYAIYDNYYNGNALRYLICLDPPKGKIYFISIANDIISADSQIFDIDFQANYICNVGTEVVLFNYDGDLAKLTPVFDIDIDNNQVNLTGVSLDIVGNYEALKKYSPYFSIDKIDAFGNRTKFFVGYYKSYNSNFTCNWIEIFHDTFHVDEWHVDVGEELSIPRSKAIYVRGYRDNFYYGIGSNDSDGDTIDNVYKFNHDTNEFVKVDSIKYSEIPFKCDIVDRVTGYNEYYSIIVREEGTSQCNIFVYTPSKYGSRYFIDSGIIKYDVRGTVIEYYTGTPRDFFDNKYIVSGNTEKYILTGKLGSIYSPLVSKKYVDSLKSDTDQKIDDLKTYTDTEISNLKDYTDNEISELIDYTDNKISDLKDYTDTENNNLKNYTDTEISDLKDYSDTELAKKVDKVTDTHSNIVAYVQNPDSTESYIDLHEQEIPNTIVERNEYGRASIADPSTDMNITNKRYVDNNFVHQKSNTDTFAKIYGRNTSDNEQSYPLRTVESPNTVVYRDNNSTFEVGEPIADKNPTTKKYVDDIGDTKVDKVTTTSNHSRLYAVDNNGNQTVYKVVAKSTLAYSVVSRDANGHAEIEEPTSNKEIANKIYVDNKSSIGLQDAKDYADQKKSEANTYTDTKISNLVNSSPETLDTLKELADALGNDPNFATTVAKEIGKKVTSIAQNGIHDNKKVYVNGSDGVDTTIDAVASNTASTIVIRDVNGNTKVSDPVDALDASNKEYVDTVGNTNLNTAKSYTDAEVSNALTLANKAASDAEKNAKSYTDTEVGKLSTSTDTKITNAVSDSKSYTDTELSNLSTKTTTDIATSLSTAKSYTDIEISKISTSTTTGLDKKVDKFTGDKTEFADIVYGQKYDGDETVFYHSSIDLPETIVSRDAAGRYEAADPVSNYQVTNKKYVDNNVSSAVNSSKEALEAEISNKVDKNTVEHTIPIAYGQNTDKTETTFNVDISASANSIARRDENGALVVGKATDENHAVTLGAVQNAIGSFEGLIINKLDTKLDKVTTEGDYTRVYSVDTTGSNKMLNATPDVVNEALVKRDSTGNFNVNNPIANNHPATKKYVDDADQLKLDKVSTSASRIRVYVIGKDGNQSTLDVSNYEIENTVVMRNEDGHFRVKSPTIDTHPTTKKYVDDAISAKEDSFTKNTAFNKNFGTTAGTVTEGNDSRLSDARPASDVSAWAKASKKPTYTKAEVGLGNVDNVKQYSASNPPPYPVTSVAGKTGAVSLTKSDVGLGNVTNDAQVKRTEMGSAGGVATLDTEGKVPASQLPSYVDDVIEYGGYNKFPLTGESGKIYVDVLTNKTYRWSGTGYTEIAQSIALGETSSTAYPGNKGKQNADNISSLQSSVTTNTSNISSLQTAVSQNTSSISTLDSNKANKTDVNSALNGKLDKDESMGSTERVYAVDPTGANHMISASSNVTANNLVQRDLNGYFYVKAPTNENNPTTKKYVDDSVSTINTSLESKADKTSLADYAKKDGSNASGTWNITASHIKIIDVSSYSSKRPIYFGTTNSTGNSDSIGYDNNFNYEPSKNILTVSKIDADIVVKDLNESIILPSPSTTNAQESASIIYHSSDFDIAGDTNDKYSAIVVYGMNDAYNTWVLAGNGDDLGTNNIEDDNLRFRNGSGNGWQSWRTLVDSKNYAEVIPLATDTKAGLMTPLNKVKLDSFVYNGIIFDGDNVYPNPTMIQKNVFTVNYEHIDNTNNSPVISIGGSIRKYQLSFDSQSSNPELKIRRDSSKGASTWSDWITLVNNSNYSTVIPVATNAKAGLMSSTDKTKLNSLDPYSIKFSDKDYDIDMNELPDNSIICYNWDTYVHTGDNPDSETRSSIVVSYGDFSSYKWELSGPSGMNDMDLLYRCGTYNTDGWHNWRTVVDSENYSSVISSATSSANGLMSKEDKIKLDSLPALTAITTEQIDSLFS